MYKPYMEEPASMQSLEKLFALAVALSREADHKKNYSSNLFAARKKKRCCRNSATCCANGRQIIPASCVRTMEKNLIFLTCAEEWLYTESNFRLASISPVSG